MKKVSVSVALAFSVSLVLACGLFAADTTPVKLSLFPGVGVPAAKVVHGLDLGIIGSGTDETQGVQLAWIYGSVDNKMVGLQSSFIAVAGEVTGIQYGFYNSAKSVKGAQLGFINVTDELNGIQLGLVNLIKKGAPLPFMVFVNANF